MYSIEEFEQQKTKVMNYILYKKRTVQEVKNKFSTTMQTELLCDIIEYVKEAGYLDDTEYIKKAVNEYQNLKTLSIKEMQYKLYTKGINKDLLEDYFYKHKEELEEYELESARKIVTKKESIMQQEELKQYLIKKGYQQQTIKEVVSCKTY